MSKKVLSVVLGAVMAFSVFGCAPAQEENGTSGDTSTASTVPAEVTFTDHDGVEVTVPANAKRIVVIGLSPIPAFIAMYTGTGENIVGMGATSMKACKNGFIGEKFPEILNANTEFMDGQKVNVEKLMALNPDLVILQAGDKEQRDMIDNAGLTTLGVGVSQFGYEIVETYNKWIEIFKQIFPENKSFDKVAGYIEENQKMIDSKVANISDEEREKIMFLFQYTPDKLVTSGNKFFGQYWANRVGAVNVTENIDGTQAPITMEQVYEWQPEKIFITNFSPATPENLYNNEIGSDDWSLVKAVQDKEVYKMPLASFNSYSMSTELPIVLLWMAKVTYPEQFKDIDITAETLSFYEDMYGIKLTEEQANAMFPVKQ